MNTNVLLTPIVSLPVSDGLKEACQLMHISTLEEIIYIGYKQLHFQKGFGVRLVQEIVALLEHHGLPEEIRKFENN